MKNKTWKRWTTEEIELLKFHWQHSDMQTLLQNFPDRNYNQLMLKAQQIGVKSLIHRSRINGNLNILLEKHKLSFYLLGFILADGCFTSKDDLSICQSEKEKNFFVNFIHNLGGKTQSIKTRNYINSYTGQQSTCVYFRVGDKYLLNEIKNRIGVSNNKTYNPPTNIAYFFEKDLLPNFLIGLIDGDGCVWLTNKGKSSPQIRIEMHYNWLPILEQIKDKFKEFYDIELKTRVSNRGFAQLLFPTVSSIKWIHQFSKETIRMERKWKPLDELFT